MKVFRPSHTVTTPLPSRSMRGTKYFHGIGQLSEAALEETSRPLFDADHEDERAAELAAICQQLRQRTAEHIGGHWEDDEVPRSMYPVGRAVMVKPVACSQWIPAVVTCSTPLRVRTSADDPLWAGCDFRPERIRVVEREPQKQEQMT